MPNIAALVTVAAVMYYVENSNPAIVSRETYDAVQALIKSRQPSCKRKAKNYPLTRTLLCPDCGHTFRRQVVNGTAYWLCAAKATNKTDCAWRRVKEDEVYAAFNLIHGGNALNAKPRSI